MAKIEFYKLKGNIPKGKKVETIAGNDGKVNEKLLIRKSELLKQECATRIKARDVHIIAQAAESETSFEK